MSDFLQRLKQRKLVQWAAAYIAAAFAFVQVLDVVAQRFAWPGRIEKLIILALVLVFIVVLVLAWYHGERGAQRISGPELLLIALVLAVGGGLLWHVTGSGPSTTIAVTRAAIPVATVAPTTSTAKPAATNSVAAQPTPAKSIAVLPFDNLNVGKQDAYFVAGVQDLILTKLADIGELKVIARTSTAGYASHPGNLTAIGQQLGVATLLEGSVQKVGNQVLINVQLIDAKSDAHIWAQSYVRTLDNVFGVEGEVAEKIAEALNAKLTTSEKTAVASIPTHNKQALDDYLRGVYYINHEAASLDSAELKQSIALLEQATRLDPAFGAAFSALSLAYQHLGGHDQQAEIAAQRALALDPHDAEAHRMVAYTLVREGKLEQALKQAKEAVRLAPNSALINNGLGNIYNASGQIDQAVAVYRHALALNPKQNIIRMNLAYMYMAQRRYADARDVLQTATVIDPGSILAATKLASVQQIGWGDLTAARKALQSVPTPVASSGALADAWYRVDLRARDYPAALAVIRKAPAAWFENQRYPLALYAALAYQAQGDESRTKAAFAKAQVQIEAWLKDSPESAQLHANLSLALAGLGHGDDAVTQARRAVKLVKEFSGDEYLVNLAAVDARTGRTDAAFKLLDELCGRPAGGEISASLLELDPAWDPIRHDPRFQALLKRYVRYKPAVIPTEPASASVS